jgi:raffinose/stachyose/melibiose transport system permease protein
MFYRMALFIHTAAQHRDRNHMALSLQPAFWRRGGNATIGIKGLDIALLGRPSTALWAIALRIWHFWGFCLLFLTAMQSIRLNSRCGQGGRGRSLSGILACHSAGHSTVVLFMMMMSMIWSFLIFEYVWILTQGGPAGGSEVLGVLIYKNAFIRFEAGYAAAQGIMITLFAAIIVGLFLFLRRRGWDV